MELPSSRLRMQKSPYAASQRMQHASRRMQHASSNPSRARLHSLLGAEGITALFREAKRKEETQEETNPLIWTGLG